jgi:hypothetical protein
MVFGSFALNLHIQTYSVAGRKVSNKDSFRPTSADSGNDSSHSTTSAPIDVVPRHYTPTPIEDDAFFVFDVVMRLVFEVIFRVKSDGPAIQVPEPRLPECNLTSCPD